MEDSSQPVDTMTTAMPKGSSSEPAATAQTSASSVGGRLVLPPDPPTFPARVLGPERLEAGSKLLPQPYASDKTPVGETLLTDYATLSSKDMIEKVIYEAAGQAAVTSALTIHAGDPQHSRNDSRIGHA